MNRRGLNIFPSAKTRTAAAAVLLALVIVPAPLLPPIGLAEKLQSVLGISYKSAYLVTAIGLQTARSGSLGVAAAFDRESATPP